MNVEAALWMCIFMYPTFLVELLTAEGLLVRSCRRRPLFWVFLVPGIFLIVAVSFLMCCLLSLADGDPIVGALGYIIVFLCTLVVFRVCYDVPFRILLFYGAGAYAFQNLCYRLVSIFEVTGALNLLAGQIGLGWAECILHVGIFAATGLLFYLFFVRKVCAQGMENLYSWNVLLLSLVTLVITVVLCSVTNTFGYMSWQLSLVIYCFSIFANIFILWIQSGMLERIVLKSDVETVRQLWQQDRRQYEIAKETIDLINVKCHDMKHRIRIMKQEGELSEEEAAEMEKCISIYDARVSTGCEPIDVLLTEKSLICNEAGIRLSCMVDGKSLGYIRDYDLYSLFGNMLSNAIEAVRRIRDEERRCIDLTVRKSGGVVLVNCVNYYDGKLRLEAGLPATSKRDVVNHGFGLKSMRMLAKKYGGQFDFSFEDGIFSITMMFPTAESRHIA